MVDTPFSTLDYSELQLKEGLFVSKAPLRVSFLGGGADFPEYFSRSGASFISGGIDKYIYTSVKRHGDIFAEKIRLNYSNIELANNLTEVRNRIVAGALQHLSITDRLFVGTISDIPSGTGLGSSSSFCVGLLSSLFESLGVSRSPAELASIANYIEMEVNKNPQGIQDAYPAAFGGLNCFRIRKDGVVLVEPVLMRDEDFFALNESMVLVFTGRSRASADILLEQKENTASQLNFDVLDYLVENVDVFLDMLVSDFSVDEFGRFLNKSWEAKKKFAGGISDSATDLLFKKILSAGAKGAKLCGAGGGGFFLCAVEPSEFGAFSTKLSDISIIKVAISKQGVTTKRFD